MKLLGWMRHKPQEHSREIQKNITIGYNCFRLSAQSSTADQETNPKSHSGSSCNSGFRRQPDERCELNGVAEIIDEEAIGKLFHGFLTIGTLGSDPSGDDPATPTFGILSINTTEGKKEVTDNGLKFNCSEPMFLEAEAAKRSNESSVRNNITISTTSTIKQMVEAEAEGNNVAVIFPIQGCQLSSLDGLPETKNMEKKEMASPGELFQRTEVIEEKFKETLGKREMQTNQTYKSPKHMIRKILTKLHASPNNSATSGIRDPTSTKGKLLKVTRIFHRKIHPENPVANRGSNKGQYAVDRDQLHADSSKVTCSQLLHSNERASSHQTSKSNHLEPKGFNSAESREQWIRTDADYLVLEL